MQRSKAIMIIGIDASNIRSGGGVTHLVELLRAAEPKAHSFSQVIVWGGHPTLSQIEDRPWLVKSQQTLLNKSLLYRAYWQRFRLSKLARTAGCDVLFVPGGSFAGDFHPMVTMSQNLLPFEWCELRRFGFTWMTLRLVILRRVQARTFQRAKGVIFLTSYAHDVVMRVIKTTNKKTAIVPHGIDGRFVNPPRKQFDISQYGDDRPFRVLYVSTVDMFKHQWNVAEAVAHLRRRGLSVVLDLVGPAYSPALKRLKSTLSRIDPTGEFVHYLGAVPYDDLHSIYSKADMCLFASSCENMPNILVEKMASGQPIACSNRGPMPEVLGNAGVYFDPENHRDILRALEELIDCPDLRVMKAKASFARAQAYSWERCARETFEYMSESINADVTKLRAGER